MTVLTQGMAATAGYIVSEAHGYRSREQIMILGGSGVLKAGTVLAMVGANKGAATVGAAAFTGTGNGALTPANPATGPDVQEGTYRIQLVDEGANAGDFAVIRPDGTTDGFASVGVAYTGQVKFTIADGATDFASPAAFTLPVAIADPAGVGKYVPFNPAGTNGSATASAVLYEGCDATAAEVDVRRTITARDTEVQIAALIWPAGITSDQKAAAMASMASFGIIGR